MTWSLHDLISSPNKAPYLSMPPHWGLSFNTWILGENKHSANTKAIVIFQTKLPSSFSAFGHVTLTLVPLDLELESISWPTQSSDTVSKFYKWCHRKPVPKSLFFDIPSTVLVHRSLRQSFDEDKTFVLHWLQNLHRSIKIKQQSLLTKKSVDNTNSKIAAFNLLLIIF